MIPSFSKLPIFYKEPFTNCKSVKYKNNHNAQEIKSQDGITQMCLLQKMHHFTTNHCFRLVYGTLIAFLTEKVI